MSNDRGYALLVGVGGSGKQSLTRLAASINSLDVFQTTIRKGFSVADLKLDLATLYIKAGMKFAFFNISKKKNHHNFIYVSLGLKNISSCYLMTDSQVVDEKFLVLINDFLATGNIPDLFPPEDVENIINSVRNEVKQEGSIDTNENCWSFFIERVRRQLKMVLCFSPVGSALRNRMRKFPAVINCTCIDWFFDWPESALESVSTRFLSEIEILPENLVEPISTFMAYVHGTVNEMSKLYYQNEKRVNYTTPKTFLELIALYKKVINEKNDYYTNRIITLQNGLLKLEDCSSQVDGLKEVLKDQEVVLNAKKEVADAQFEVVSSENVKVQAEKDFATEREKKVRIIEEDVSAKAKICAIDLKKAEPIMLKAIAALDTLDKNSLTEMKAFTSPPVQVANVCIAVLILFSKGKKVTPEWKSCKSMMGNVGHFLNNLRYFDKKHIRPEVIEALLPYINSPDFDPEKIKHQSAAASGLCEWVINIHKFYKVYLDVGPKERALNASEKELKEAQDELVRLNEKLVVLQTELNVLQKKLDEVTAAKEECQAEADKTSLKIDLAFRLVDGLASEKIRWTNLMDEYAVQISNLPGDVLLISCFLSYVGCFTSQYRADLQTKYWMPKFESIEPPIPFSNECDPVYMMSDDAIIAEWNNQGKEEQCKTKKNTFKSFTYLLRPT